MCRSCDISGEKKNKANLILEETQRNDMVRRNRLILIHFQSVRLPLHLNAPSAQHTSHQKQFKGKPADKHTGMKDEVKEETQQSFNMQKQRVLWWVNRGGWRQLNSCWLLPVLWQCPRKPGCQLLLLPPGKGFGWVGYDHFGEEEEIPKARVAI